MMKSESTTSTIDSQPTCTKSGDFVPCEAMKNGKRKWRVTVLISGSGSNLQALLDSLPSTLSSHSIVSVISNSKEAYGLKRASTHSPPIPTISFSPYNHQKNHPELYSDIEKRLKFLSEQFKNLEEPSSERKEKETEWKRLKTELTLSIKPRYQLELASKIKSTRPDLIVLAGFMLILLPTTLSELKRDWDEEDDLSPSSSSSSSSSMQTTSLKSLGQSPYLDPTGLRGKPIPIINLHPALPGSFIGPHVIEDAWRAFNQRELPSSSKLEPGLVWKAENENDVSPFGEKIEKTGIMIHRVIPELDRGEPVLWKEIEMKEGEGLDELKERIHKVEHVAIVEAVKKVTDLLENGEWWKEEGGDKSELKKEEEKGQVLR